MELFTKILKNRRKPLTNFLKNSILDAFINAPLKDEPQKYMDTITFKYSVRDGIFSGQS